MSYLKHLLLVLGALSMGIAALSTQSSGDQRILDAKYPGARLASDSTKTVREKLKSAEIIPTVVDDFVPSLLLDAKWSSENRASLGNTLKPGKLQDAPSIFLGGHRSHQVDTVVILTDPDAPSRKDPKWAEVCHWIARSHVPPSAQTDGEFDESAPSHSLGLEDIMPYKPPGPPEGTGKHRYVFLALVPRNGTTERLHPTKPGDRKHWGYDSDDGETRGVREWARENGLVPVAANFLYAKH